MMRNLFFLTVLLAGSALAQPTLDANSIVVTTSKIVTLLPTEAVFSVNVSADIGITLDQVLAAVDLGLTPQDLAGINSYPIGPYPPVPSSRINYMFRLSVPVSSMKATIEKLEKLRKTLDTGMDLNYSTSAVGPSQAAVQDAREKVLPDLIADARRRAQSLAAAAQLKLGAIQSINEAYAYSGSAIPLPATVNFSIVVRFAAQ